MSDLEQILEQSRADKAFKDAVRSYTKTGTADHVQIEGFAPAVKVRRVLAHMLSAEPDLQIERVSVRGRSGCSDFVGRIRVYAGDEVYVYDFAWDCRWRAEQEGWTDCFGFPDQIRAAREYDWRCFERWEQVQNTQPALHIL